MIPWRPSLNINVINLWGTQKLLHSIFTFFPKCFNHMKSAKGSTVVKTTGFLIGIEEDLVVS